VVATPKLEIDPFGEVSGPSLYVMREATEHALAELLHCGGEPARPAVLLGPAGIGKSLLLQVAGRSIDDAGHCVFVSFPSLDTENLCRWILDQLECPRFEDPVFAFETYLGRLREIGSSLLLLVDDLHLMPTHTVHQLRRWIDNSRGEFRLIASAINDPQSYEKIAPLGPTCQQVLFKAPMQQDESSLYIKGRLDLAGAAAATRALFDRNTVAKLHRLSGGVPRELNAAAANHLRLPANGCSAPERSRKWRNTPGP
jgi:type II secretory pathway predicted ATPase ExeA